MPSAGRYDAGQPAEEEISVLRGRINLGALPPLGRSVTERVICASGDMCYQSELVFAETWLERAVSALADGAPVIVDSPMVAAGITSAPAMCKAGEALAARLARTAGIGLAAAAVRLALGDAGPGAVWVVGSEPAAIFEILSRGALPALVIAMPAGLAGAAEAKQVLRDSGLPALTNVGEKGGPAVAAAACEALLAEAAGAAAASAQARR